MLSTLLLQHLCNVIVDNFVVVTSLHKCSVAVVPVPSFETKVAGMRKIFSLIHDLFLGAQVWFLFNLLSHCSSSLLTQLVSTKVVPVPSTVKTHALFALHSKDYKSVIFEARLPCNDDPVIQQNV